MLRQVDAAASDRCGNAVPLTRWTSTILAAPSLRAKSLILDVIKDGRVVR
jgi:hypothetical protein